MTRPAFDFVGHRRRVAELRQRIPAAAGNPAAMASLHDELLHLVVELVDAMARRLKANAQAIAANRQQLGI